MQISGASLPLAWLLYRGHWLGGSTPSLGGSGDLAPPVRSSPVGQVCCRRARLGSPLIPGDTSPFLGPILAARQPAPLGSSVWEANVGNGSLQGRVQKEWGSWVGEFPGSPPSPGLVPWGLGPDTLSKWSHPGRPHVTSSTGP